MVDNVVFEASGPPGWHVEIGDDIGLRLTHAFYDGTDIAYTIRLYPRTPAREWNGIRRWRSVSGNQVTIIEASPGPCRNAGGTVYAQNVRLIRNWDLPEFRNLSGCGGRVISGPDPS